VLDRLARRQRQDDAEVAEALRVGARDLQLLAAALLHTLRKDEVRMLQRSKRGGEALAQAVQQERKLITARPSVQQAMGAQWAGLQLDFEGIFECAVAYSVLALPVLFILIAAPEHLAEYELPGAFLLVAMPSWERAILLIGLAPATVLFLYFTKNADKLGSSGILVVFAVCTLANPTFPIVLTSATVVLFVVAGAAEPLSRWLSDTAEAADEAWLKRAPVGRYLAPFFLPLVPLASPRGKFWLSTAARIVLALALCALPPPATAPLGATSAMLVWVALSLIDELLELLADVDFWFSDFLNRLELPGLLLATGGLLFSLISGEPADGALAAAVACVLMAQGLRMMMLSIYLGPLVLMTITMVEKDLIQWLGLLLVGVLLPFSTASYLLYERGESFNDEVLDGHEEDDEYCAASALTLGRGVFAASWMLFKTLIGGGDALVDCLATSSAPVLGVVIMETCMRLPVGERIAEHAQVRLLSL
jgi:hypothetical protein